MSENLKLLGAYRALRSCIRDGKIVEHWGGRHCQDGVGLTH